MRLDICDPVLAFDKIMEKIGIEKYLRPEPLHKLGRPVTPLLCLYNSLKFGNFISRFLIKSFSVSNSVSAINAWNRLGSLWDNSNAEI